MVMSLSRRRSAELARPPGRPGSVWLGPGPRRPQQPRWGHGAQGHWGRLGPGQGPGVRLRRRRWAIPQGLRGTPRGFGGRQGQGCAGAGGESRARKWRRGPRARCSRRPGRGPGSGSSASPDASSGAGPAGCTGGPRGPAPRPGMRRGGVGRSRRRSRHRR